MSNTKQYWIHHCLAIGRSDLEISFKALLGNQIWPPWSQTPHGSLQSHCAFMRCAFPVAQSTAHGTPNAGTPAYSTAMCLCVISAWTREEEKIVMKMSLQAKQGCRSLWEPPLSQECTGFAALVAYTHIGQGQKTSGQREPLPYLGLSPPCSRLGPRMHRASPAI